MSVILANNLAAQDTAFSITDTKHYNLVVTLSTQDNTKLLEQLKSGFKWTIDWHKYQWKISAERINQYSDYLIDPVFQGVHRLFILMFRNEAQRISYKEYYLPTVEINYNVMVEGKNFFDKPVRNNFKKNDNIRKIATGQVDGYTTGCKQLVVNNKHFWCRSKSNTTNQFYWKSISVSKIFFHYWRREISSFSFFIRNCKSILI